MPETAIPLSEQIAVVRDRVEYWEGFVNEIPEPQAGAQLDLWRAVLATLESSRWQPIETAPKDGREILIGWFEFQGQRSMAVAFWHSMHKAWCSAHTLFTKDQNWQPTHWRPRPALPADDK